MLVSCFEGILRKRGKGIWPCMSILMYAKGTFRRIWNTTKTWKTTFQDSLENPNIKDMLIEIGKERPFNYVII